MSSILKLRGAAALSAFRLEKLSARLSAVHPSIRLQAADFWHFADVARALTPAEERVLGRLLEDASILREGPGQAPGGDRTGRMLLVVPRIGTISPWSSKATDIARACGPQPVRRIERGIAYHLSGEDEPEIAALLADRMTESVLAS